MYAIVSIGGTMPPFRFGTILRFNTPCAMPQRMGSRKCRGGRSLHRVRISASYITRPTDQYQCSSMEAAKTSWASGIREQTRGRRILPTMPSYRPRKYGPGVLTRMGLIGATRSPTTTAPMSSCKQACSEIKRPMHSSNRSEEHTSELQSHSDLVCRLLLEKKKK